MFEESNTVKAFVRDLLCGAQHVAGRVADARPQKPGFCQNPGF